jgi:hypothetical protein
VVFICNFVYAFLHLIGLWIYNIASRVRVLLSIDQAWLSTYN